MTKFKDYLQEETTSGNMASYDYPADDSDLKELIKKKLKKLDKKKLLNMDVEELIKLYTIDRK